MRCVAGALLVLAACRVRPERAAWNEKENAVRPEAPASESCLQVETEGSGAAPDEVVQVRPFYVYEVSGAYLTCFTNHLAEPVLLPPGRYVVVSRCEGKNRRVQVFLETARRTTVRLPQLQAAPAVDE